MKLFIVGFACFTIGVAAGFIVTALMCTSGNEERCREYREKKC